MALGNPQETGNRGKCAFNTIPSFHVIDNLSVDVMHDVVEGICHYDMANSTLHFIQNKFLTLDLLNSRKRTFEYGDIEIGNISPTRHYNKSSEKSTFENVRE